MRALVALTMLSKSLWPTTALMLSLPWFAVDVRGHANHHRDSWWKGKDRKGNLTITDPAKAALMKKNSDDTCITVDLHAEGFGSEYTAVMGVFGMARYSNLAYCHKRLESWSHPNSFTADEARAMIGIQPGVNCKRCKYAYAHTAIAQTLDKADRNLVFTDTVRDELRGYSLAWHKPPTHCHYDDNRTDIAVHIRRGDVTAAKFAKRFSDARLFAAQINKLRASTKGKGKGAVHFHIFSETEPLELKEAGIIPRGDTTFHKGMRGMDTFHCFVRADVLVCDKSTFSTSAAILSRGIVYDRNSDRNGLSSYKQWH